MARSADATCNGIYSPEEGPTVYVVRRGKLYFGKSEMELFLVGKRLRVLFSLFASLSLLRSSFHEFYCPFSCIGKKGKEGDVPADMQSLLLSPSFSYSSNPSLTPSPRIKWGDIPFHFFLLFPRPYFWGETVGGTGGEKIPFSFSPFSPSGDTNTEYANGVGDKNGKRKKGGW